MRRFRLSKFKINPKLEDGQTLIETIVAMFILVTAIVACLALALYAIRSSSSTRNQTIATNLAREGVEVVRMMRDSNWLNAEDLAAVDDLQLCTFAAGVQRPCYPEAFDEPYDLNSPTSSTEFRALFRISGGVGGWVLDTRNGIENFLLCVQPDGTYQHNDTSGTVSCGEEAQFARKISITTGSTTAPYTANNNNPTASVGHSPEKRVTSTVIWKGKGCTSFAVTQNPETLTTPCKITVTESLTNWKDYR